MKSTKTAATCFTGTERAAKVTDPDFKISVLERYRITIVPSKPPIDPKQHFGLTGLPDGFDDRLKNYKVKYPGLEVWQHPEKDDILQGYHFMQREKCNEVDHSTFALGHIFRTQLVRHEFGEQQQRLLPYQVLQLAWMPSEENDWHSPPLFWSIYIQGITNGIFGQTAYISLYGRL